MKKIAVFVVALLALNIAFVFFLFNNASADSVMLKWDSNNSDPDGYRLFQRLDGDIYDYTSPILIQGITDDNGNIPPNITTVTIDNLGIICNINKYHWVVRAFVRSEESSDSNEVNYIVNWSCPATVINFQADFDIENSNINMSFQQPGEVPVIEWKIYWTRTSGQDYVLFDIIPNDGSNSVTVTKPFAEVVDGDRETIYFAIVSFRRDDLFSENSEVAVDIDRRIPQPPILQLITIPIQ